MGKRNQQYNSTLGNTIGDAIDALENFTSEVRESADNMSETFPGAERTERYESAADELEGIETDTEVPDALIDVAVSFTQDERKGISKGAQLGNLVDWFAAIADAAEDASAGTEDEDLQAYVDQLREAAEALQGIEL